MPGCARAWKWMEGEIGHWLVHPLCPRNQFILPPCPAPGFEWKDGWKEVSAEASPPLSPIQNPAHFIFLLNDSSRLPCPGKRMNDWEDYTFVSRFLICLLHGGEERGGLSWGGGCGGYYFSFIEEKIEACKCLMWGFNVWTERSICILAAQMVCTDWMVWVSLPAGLLGPASACVPVQLASPAASWQSQTWNYAIYELQTVTHLLHGSVVALTLLVSH